MADSTFKPKPCVRCGKKPAIIRAHSKKIECKECSRKSFKKWLKEKRYEKLFIVTSIAALIFYIVF